MIVIGVVALIAAAVFARCGTQTAVVAGPAVTAKKVDFPRDRALRALNERARARAAATTTTTTTTPAKVDRLTRALSSPGGAGAVIIEVNSLRHSPLVEAILACRAAQGSDDMQGLALMKEELGIDIGQDVDRIALDGEVLAVSGFFSKLQLPAELGEGDAYGDGGRIFSMTDNAGKPAFMARVGDDLVMTSTDDAQLKAAIDRAEGRVEAAPSFPEGVVGGEIYGLIGPEMIKTLLGASGDPALAGMADLLTTSALRMAVDEDAALSLDIGARSEKDAADIGKAISGLLAVARADARTNGETELAALLEQARIEPHADGSIAVDIAIPGADLLRMLGCPAVPSKGGALPSTTTTKE